MFYLLGNSHGFEINLSLYGSNISIGKYHCYFFHHYMPWYIKLVHNSDTIEISIKSMGFLKFYTK